LLVGSHLSPTAVRVCSAVECSRSGPRAALRGHSCRPPPANFALRELGGHYRIGSDHPITDKLGGLGFVKTKGARSASNTSSETPASSPRSNWAKVVDAQPASGATSSRRRASARGVRRRLYRCRPASRPHDGRRGHGCRRVYRSRRDAQSLQHRARLGGRHRRCRWAGAQRALGQAGGCRNRRHGRRRRSPLGQGFRSAPADRDAPQWSAGRLARGEPAGTRQPSTRCLWWPPGRAVGHLLAPQIAAWDPAVDQPCRL
jgi:hypothetical protein